MGKKSSFKKKYNFNLKRNNQQVYNMFFAYLFVFPCFLLLLLLFVFVGSCNILNGNAENKLAKKVSVPVNSQAFGIKSWINNDYTIQQIAPSFQEK